MSATLPSRFAGFTPLFHVTHADNVQRIKRYGLETAFARGRKRIWLCTEKRLAWALNHVPASHGHRSEEYVILQVFVPSSDLRRARKGIFTTDRNVANWAILVNRA